MSPFSGHIPNLQTVWDSTSLGWLKTCPTLYYYKMIRGKDAPGAKQALVFGIAIHHALEVYDARRIEGLSHDEAQKIALREGLLQLGYREERVECTHCGHIYHPDEEYCRECYTQRDEDCLGHDEVEVWRFYELDSYHSPEALARAIVWYTEQYQNDPLETYVLPNGKTAVELSFTSPTGIETQDGEEILLSGHIDRVVTDGIQLWIMDRKTSKQQLYQSFFDKFSPDNQVSLYALASQLVLDRPAAGVIIDGIQKAVQFTRFSRGYAPRTPAQISEFLEDLKVWVFHAELYAKMDHWPMNDKACDLYGGCPFRSICSKDPAVREQYLAQFPDFQWNPLDRR